MKKLAEFRLSSPTKDCTSVHPINTIIKFTNVTTLVGLILAADDSLYRAEVHQLVMWCSANNLAKENKINHRHHEEQRLARSSVETLLRGSMILNFLGPLFPTISPGLPHCRTFKRLSKESTKDHWLYPPLQ